RRRINQLPQNQSPPSWTAPAANQPQDSQLTISREGFRVRSSSSSRLAIMASISATLVVTACGGGASGATAQAQAKPTAAPAAIPIPAEPATRTDIQQSVSLTGSVTATNQISVLPQAAGRLESIYVDVGSAVKAGDVVAQLDSSSAQIAVQQQQAS